MNTFSKIGCLALACAACITTPASAREVRMVFGLALPPYVIEGSASGYEVDIVRAALAVKGHTLKPVFASFLLVPKMLGAHQADAAQRGAPELAEGKGYYYADQPTVVYHDAAITLKKSGLHLDSIADLKGKAIVAYQGAHQFLGSSFGATVKDNPNYQESSDEKRKLKMLYAGGTQVYVGDVNVFQYYRGQVKGDVDITQPTVIHDVFPPSGDPTHNAVFIDPQLRDDFNAGLKQIKASGEYQRIIRNYLGS